MLSLIMEFICKFKASINLRVSRLCPSIHKADAHRFAVVTVAEILIREEMKDK